MEGKRLIRSLRLTNILSFGPQTLEIDLEALNVLIGPNMSGKSNLLEVIALLKSAASDLTAPIREGGGVGEWLWKGARQPVEAGLEATIDYPDGIVALRYKIILGQVGQRFEIIDEAIEDVIPTQLDTNDVYFYYRYQRGHPVLNTREITKSKEVPGKIGTRRALRREDIKPDQSVLAQRRDRDFYPELTYLADQFSAIRLFRDWSFGRYTEPRLPQKADQPDDFLLENSSNLGMVLNDLIHRGLRQTLLERLRIFYEYIDDISVRIYGGTVQIYLHERGLAEPVPATRLSDGILRYLILLALLCHPNPPPLLAIEEPELGMHPDAIQSIAELLIEASHRTQLVVTTHSESLVSALSDLPEAILVCERFPDGTLLRRLKRENLTEWLEKYSLGQLWMMGEIGGTRW